MYILMVSGSNSVAIAYDETGDILPRIQGMWYDERGNVVLDIHNNTLNDCDIVGIYDVAGGRSDFSCIIRIVELEGYRDIPVIFKGLTKENYHTHLLLNGDNKKGQLLIRYPKAKYYESVGGIGLDMTAKEVIAKYGMPDSDSTARIWKYRNLGMMLGIEYNRVSIIAIMKNGNRHFDRTGFNCKNKISEFKDTYGLNQMPEAGKHKAYNIGYGEYIWFEMYPDMIMLSTDRT